MISRLKAVVLSLTTKKVASGLLLLPPFISDVQIWIKVITVARYVEWHRSFSGLLGPVQPHRVIHEQLALRFLRNRNVGDESPPEAHHQACAP